MLQETGKNKKREGLFPSLIFFIFSKAVGTTSFWFFLIAILFYPSLNVFQSHRSIIFLFKLFIIRFFLVKFSISIGSQCDSFLLNNDNQLQPSTKTFFLRHLRRLDKQLLHLVVTLPSPPIQILHLHDRVLGYMDSMG